MNIALPQTRMTVDEYLVWAEDKPGRFELVDGWVFAMAPERVRHARVKGTVYRALCAAVEAARLPCEVFPDGVTIRIDKSSAREPDASVQCGARADPDAVTIEAPLIVVEVVSPSSQRKDNDLLLEYFSVPSIQHYLIVHSKKRAVTHYRRNEHGSIDTRIAHVGEKIELEPPGMNVAVAALLGAATAGAQED